MVLSYNVQVNGFNQLVKATEKLNETNKNLAKVNSNITSMNKSINQLSTTITDKLGLSKVNKQFLSLKEYSANIKTGFSDLKNSFKVFSDTFNSGIYAGVGKLESFKRAFTMFKFTATDTTTVLGKALLVFKGALVSTLLPIAAIVAAFLILKRMFTLNVGGMQTQWHKLMGNIKSTWAQVSLVFDKVLKSIGPLISSVFKTIGSILNPIIDVLRYLGKQILSIFGDTSNLEGFSSILKVVGIVFEILGKVIGAVLKIAFFPLKIAIGVIVSVFKGMINYVKWGIDIYKQLFQTIGNSAFFKTLMTGFKTIGEFIQNYIINPISLLIELITKLFDTLANSKVGKFFGLGEAAEKTKGGSSGTSKTTNNNQQITFNTNRSTSPENTKSFADQLALSLTM